MNLKTAFREQNHLDELMSGAKCALYGCDNALTIKKTHNKSAADSEATDITEIVESTSEFSVDVLIDFLVHLIQEKENLTSAIARAKSSISFDLDANVAANKYRQEAASSITALIKARKPYKRTERSVGHRINGDGNQTEYVYDVNVTAELSYDVAKAKEIATGLRRDSDKISEDIERAMITTEVYYLPVYDINMSFEDAVDQFVENRNQ